MTKKKDAHSVKTQGEIKMAKKVREHSLNEIAEELGVSRQGAALIQHRALKKLRDSELSKYAIYVEDDPIHHDQKDFFRLKKRPI